MTSVRPGTAPTPEAHRPAAPKPAATPDDRLVRPAPGTPDRRVVQLAVLTKTPKAPKMPAPPPRPAVTVPKPRGARFPLPTSRDDWLCLAERMIGDWAATLRAALLLLLVFAVMIMSIGIAFGLGSAAAATAVGLLVFLAGRRCGDSPPD